MYSSAKQGGSIKIFVIVAVILALIALGVLYGVKRVAMSDGTPPMDLPETSETDTDGDTNGSAGSDDRVTDSDTDTDVDTDPSAPSQDDGDSATGGVANEDQSTGQGESAVDDQSSEETSELPQTGPAETFAAISLGLVAASAVAYIRSLRHL